MKRVYEETGKSKSHRNYENNPYKTKKAFDEAIDKMIAKIAKKRQERKNRKTETYKNCVDRYFSKLSGAINSHIRNDAKRGNDNTEIRIDRTIQKPEYDLEIDHRNYAKSSRYWQGYDYETYILKLPIGWAVEIIDGFATVYQAKYKKVGDYFVRNAYIFSRHGLEKCLLVQNDNYSSHTSSIKKGIKDISRKQKKDYPTLTADTKLTRKKYSALTGACEIGIDTFCKDHNLENIDSITVADLLKIEENFYGKDKIKKMLIV